jgi:protein ImuB
MRTLCLNFRSPQESSSAEAFLTLSPRVQYRYPQWIFIDIESTAHLFGGEHPCLEKALEIAQAFSESTTAAIANHPAIAEVFAKWRPNYISPPKEAEGFHGLSLDAIKDLQGLEVWKKPTAVEHMIQVFHSLGAHSVEDILQFRQTSLRERWGDFGVLLWNRLHSQDIQVISPLCPRDPLVGYHYFDDPVGHVHLLMHAVVAQLNIIFARLLGGGRFAQKIELILHCEFSEKTQTIQIEPASPSRDRDLFFDLLDRKLHSLNFENPIRDFEISIYDVPEKIQQLDFFETRDRDSDRWRRLISFAQQADCQMGFLQIEAHLFPEKSFSLVTDWPQDFTAQDFVEWNAEALQIKYAHAKSIAASPRPSLLLNDPRPLQSREVQGLKFLSSFPSERIEAEWWKQDEKISQNRDYYFALSVEGQMLWVFKDRLNSQFYLHGYFD